jgi:hypothetical protein
MPHPRHTRPAGRVPATGVLRGIGVGVEPNPCGLRHDCPTSPVRAVPSPLLLANGLGYQAGQPIPGFASRHAVPGAFSQEREPACGAWKRAIR